ncbi:hypothetical protein CS022_23510 [Veronia nyctiphanis]|uniref:Bacterial Ig-like domain-containing protein n=1 Tax=Veronia nyctiphanis TaxID=1278244 RepID=A0A4Q0YI45_9GAMM|nr:Ig-like domain-containing protein [Veronia nyctiphanis]RXJ70386.1 hypothetical protein CS022_23510 [Veronia nyctiphanis]
MKEIQIQSLEDIKVAGFDVVYQDESGGTQKFSDALVAIARGDLTVTKGGKKVPIDEIIEASGINVKSLESVFLENVLTEDKTISNLVDQVQQKEIERDAALKRVKELEKKTAELEKAEKLKEQQLDRKDNLDESLKRISELEKSIKETQDQLAKKNSELKDKSLEQILLMRELQKEGEPLTESVEIVEKQLMAAENEQAEGEKEGDEEKSNVLRPPKLSDLIVTASTASAAGKVGGQPKYQDELSGTSEKASAELDEKFKILTEGEYVGIATAGEFKLEVSGVNADAVEIIVQIAGQDSEGELKEVIYTLTEKTGWQIPDTDLTDFGDGVLFVTADLRNDKGDVISATNEVTLDQTINENDEFNIALTVEGKEYNAVDVENAAFQFEGVDEDIASIEITLIQGDKTQKSILYAAPWLPAEGILSQFDDGEVIIQAKMTDRAGNTSFATEKTLQIDTSADNDETSFEIALDLEEGIYNASQYGSESFSLQGIDDDARTVTITLSQGGETPLTQTFELAPPFTVADDIFKVFNDGTVVITAIVTDDAGNTQAAPSRSIKIDTSADEGERFSVELDVSDGLYNAQESATQSFSFEGIDTDAASVTVIIEKDGVEVDRELIEPPFSVASDFFSGLADGSYSVRAIVTDEAGNTNEAEIRTVTIDSSADKAEVFEIVPAIEGREYSGIEYTSRSFSLQGIDPDAASVTVEIKQSGTPPIIESLNLTAPFSIPNDVLSVFDNGEVVINATVFDHAGNSQSAAVKRIIIDKSADADENLFSIDLATPDGVYNATEYLNQSINLNGIDDDAESVNIVIEQFGKEKINITLEHPFDVPSTLLSLLEHGEATIRATVRDDAGNVFEAMPKPINIDLSADIDETPFTIVLDIPDGTYNGNEFKTKSFSLLGVDDDVVEVTITLTHAGGEETIDLSSPFDVPTDVLSTLTDGQVTIRAVAVDEAGNTKSAPSQAIKIDTSADLETDEFTIIPDIDGKEYNAQEFNKKSFSFDGIDSDVTSVRVTMSQGDTVNTFDLSPPFNVSPSALSIFEDGIVSIEAFVTDSAGNTKHAAPIEITIDKLADADTEDFEIALAIPDGLYNATEYLEKSFTLNGIDPDVESIQVTIEQSGADSVTKTLRHPFDVPTDILSSFSDGKVTIKAKVTDDAGNTHDAQPQFLTIDTSADSDAHHFGIVLDNIDGIYNSEEYLEKDFTLTGIDSDATQVVVTIEQAEHETVTRTLKSPNFSIPEGILGSFSDGEVKISAVVTDKAGNTFPAEPQTIVIDTLASLEGEQFKIIPTITGEEYNVQEYKTQSFLLEGVDPEAIKITVELSQAGTDTVKRVLSKPFDVPKDIFSGFSDGIVRIKAVVEDQAGNTQVAKPKTITIDKSADLDGDFAIQPEVSSIPGEPFNADDVTGQGFTLTGSTRTRKRWCSP